jgi:hypothetical protein
MSESDLPPLPDEPELRTRVLVFVAAELHLRAVRQYEALVDRLPELSPRLADAIVVAHHAVARTENVLIGGLAALADVRRVARHAEATAIRLGELEADDAWPVSA